MDETDEETVEALKDAIDMIASIYPLQRSAAERRRFMGWLGKLLEARAADMADSLPGNDP